MKFLSSITRGFDQLQSTHLLTVRLHFWCLWTLVYRYSPETQLLSPQLDDFLTFVCSLFVVVLVVAVVGLVVDFCFQVCVYCFVLFFFLFFFFFFLERSTVFISSLVDLGCNLLHRLENILPCFGVVYKF